MSVVVLSCTPRRAVQQRRLLQDAVNYSVNFAVTIRVLLVQFCLHLAPFSRLLLQLVFKGCYLLDSLLLSVATAVTRFFSSASTSITFRLTSANSFFCSKSF